MAQKKADICITITKRPKGSTTSAHLKPLVLENLLNCHHLLAVDEASLVDHSKGAISYNLYVCVGHFLWAIGALAGCGYHCGHFATISCEEAESRF